MDQAEEFGRRMTSMIADFQSTLSLGVGQRVGLVRLMLDDSKPLTSLELARRANLKERYVREWLGNMVASRIVVIEVKDGERKYCIPSTHHIGIRAWCSIVPTVIQYAERLESVVSCFKTHGPYGFGYDAFPHYVDSWNDFREDTSDDWISQQIEHYKEFGITDKLKHGAKVLDMGSGTGNYTICFAKRYPLSTFKGVELDDLMIETANANVTNSGLTNVTFQKGDSCSLPDEFAGWFNLVLAVELIHNLSDPAKALSECRKVLKPGGVLSMIEPSIHSKPEDNVGNMEAAARYSSSIFECLPCSMSREPHIGFGGGWGMEELEKTVTAIPMTIVAKHKLNIFPSVHYICIKP